MTIVQQLRFPQCDFPLVSTQTAYELIAEKLYLQEPASIIRLGDGEGMVLARPTLENKHLWDHLCCHFGPSVTPDFVESLAEQLVHAIHTANILGIRDDLVGVEFTTENFNLDKGGFTRNFRRQFKLRQVETDIGYPAALRLALLHRFISSHSFRSDQIFASAWLHFMLSESGDLIRLISSQKNIGLISSKPILARELEKHLKTRITNYQIPDIYHLSHGSNEAAQLPATLVQTLDSIRVNFRGQLFLVGAGVFGKVYCNRIKEMGGIAVDVGAVCDSWLGIPSRPLVFRSLYNVSGNKVPESLLLAHQAKNL